MIAVRRHLITALAAAALTLGTVVVGAPAAQADDSDLAVTGLQTNNRTKPLGIGGDDPSFSWRSTSNARGVTQGAYEVRVMAADDEVWSSGKVESAKQLDVAYAGPALESQTRYSWQVKVWDGDDHESAWSEATWFETGLLTGDEWTGDWIGTSSTIDQWTDYTATFDFTMGTQPVLGVYVRAEDDKNGYMWQLSAADPSGRTTLRPHKRVNGAFSLLDDKDISSTISQAALSTGAHTLGVTVDGNTITTTLDGEQIDTRTDSSFAKGVIGIRESGPENASIQAITVKAKGGEVIVDEDFADGSNPFTGGTVSGGSYRVSNGEALWNLQSSKPLLRKEFATDPDKTIARARVYASAQGVYQLELNGEKVGDQHLAPGMTNYNKRMQYQTYDVTDQVNSGANAIGAQLGNGWFTGRIGWSWAHLYGMDLTVMAQLRIDYTDGSHQVIATDDSWKTHAGPWTATDNLDGESYDARLEQPGWDHPGFDDAGWAAARVAPSVTSRLVPQPDEPVRTTEELPAKEHTTPSANTHVYDLGQNMVGVARLRLQGVAGETVKIRYGEVLNPDGSLYTANLRSAKATDRYHVQDHGHRCLRADIHLPRLPLSGDHRHVRRAGDRGRHGPGVGLGPDPDRHPRDVRQHAQPAGQQHLVGPARQLLVDPDRHAGPRRAAGLHRRPQRLRADRKLCQRHPGIPGEVADRCEARAESRRQPAGHRARRE